MSDAGKALEEKRIHLIFQVSLLLKGMFAIVEIVGGVLAYVVPRQFILAVIAELTQKELAEDPRDLVAHYLLHMAQNLSVSTLCLS
jgi:uncharacterized membrane protein